ncbi:hypothetical protein [Glycomyces sp. NPDC048151]|uniref:hypothetical protein n=1 Tax=Glycomyces sp. NPDC048151 TaxID=3364002 RepID=UPI0037106634
MAEVPLLGLGVLIQLYVVVILAYADRVAEIGILHLTSAMFPSGTAEPQRPSAGRLLAVWALRVVVAVATLLIAVLPFALVEAVTVEFALVGPSWKWFYATSAIAVASGMLTWLMMLRGKRSEAKIRHGVLILPTLASIGGHAATADVADQVRAAGLISRRGFFTRTVGFTATIASCLVYATGPVLAEVTGAEPDGYRYAMLMGGAVVVGVASYVFGRLQTPAGEALRRIEYLYGSRLSEEERDFRLVTAYRASLPRYLRAAAVRYLRKDWFTDVDTKGPRMASMALIAAADVVERADFNGSAFAAAPPAKVREAGQRAAAVLVSPWDRAAITALARTVEVLDEHGEVRSELVEATEYRLQRRLRDMTDLSGRVLAAVGGAVAAVTSIATLMKVF